MLLTMGMEMVIDAFLILMLVITTALIPGKPAPRLITNDMISVMKPGSVIVDMAAEAGGNVEATKAGSMVEHDGVKIIGYTDLVSRMATQSSSMYANNLLKFVSSFKKDDKAS